MSQDDYQTGSKIDLDEQSKNNPLDFAHTNGKGNYQGDMMLTKYQLHHVNRKSRKSKRRGGGLYSSVKSTSLRFAESWPKRGSHVTIPYKIVYSAFDADERANIARAFEEFEKNTCIRYKHI